MCVDFQYDYDTGLDPYIYDPEVFFGRIKGKLLYTDQEARNAPNEVQGRLLNMQRSCLIPERDENGKYK